VIRLKRKRVRLEATPQSLQHDEWILRWAREYLEDPDVVTVAPVIGPHSIDLIVFEKGAIRFIEAKGAKAQQSPLEKHVQEVIERTPMLTYEIRRYR